MCIYTYVIIACMHRSLEMQQDIDISPYRDILGSDTILIHI